MSALPQDLKPLQVVPHAGRQRVGRDEPLRVRRDGKFFRLGDEKFTVKGVTYGPFEPNAAGEVFPEPDQAQRDFAQMKRLGANTLRIYHLPPAWFLQAVQEAGLKLLVDVAWAKNMVWTDDPTLEVGARDVVRTAAREVGNHPAVFAISLVNEIPADIVRYVGHGPVEDFIDELAMIVKAEAPGCLVTFANYPPTEYLQPREIDFVSFNVYLHDPDAMRRYLTRLQLAADAKPLVLTEYGLDTHQEGDEQHQANLLAGQLKVAYEAGVAGAFVFAFTDDWYTQGWRIEDWKFGLVRRDRSEKPSFEAVRQVFERAPQTADDKLPKVSVIICSYNGASTVESCLKSMERLRYPDFEVVFVDDGSTDSTQAIVARFPWVINIKQTNHGLSHARNVGLHAATGDIVAYTDSDCEADEDWLYYLALGLVRSGHVGIGGPNLIPDEGSWVADCVGVSPGGPTHVMIDDTTAEHVPGCNMAFYRWAALEIDGFDPQFRSAGDDVDFIWRLQHRGGSIGFAPAAQVWHYRRNTVNAYLKQQRGYGNAEAMLKFKHPDHFNQLGASHWRGRIYGGHELIGVKVGRDVIYHGVFGTGLFQTIYRRPASMLAMMLMSVEWHLLALFTALLGFAARPLLLVAVGMLALPPLLALVASAQAKLPRRGGIRSRLLVAYLHWRQPIARGWARYTYRLRAKELHEAAHGYKVVGPLPRDPAESRCLRYFSQERSRIDLATAVADEAKDARLRRRVDSGWHNWDLELYASRYVKIRLTTVSEHWAAGMMSKVRLESRMTTFLRVLMSASVILSAVLAFMLWPYGRPAVLIPVALWTIYLLHRYRVVSPVLGMIDKAAKAAGFTPVLDERQKHAAESAQATAEATPADPDRTGHNVAEATP
ncbi:MAG: glycosyltransferase [Phycisphaerae bacterium]